MLFDTLTCLMAADEHVTALFVNFDLQLGCHAVLASLIDTLLYLACRPSVAQGMHAYRLHSFCSARALTILEMFVSALKAFGKTAADKAAVAEVLDHGQDSPCAHTGACECGIVFKRVAPCNAVLLSKRVVESSGTIVSRCLEKHSVAFDDVFDRMWASKEDMVCAHECSVSAATIGALNEARRVFDALAWQFNNQPKLADFVKSMVQYGILSGNVDAIMAKDAEEADLAEPAAIVSCFLHWCPSVSPVRIGEVFAKDRPFHRALVSAYVERFDFSGLHVDEALRFFLESFRINGEGQIIDRIVERFSEHFFRQCCGEAAARIMTGLDDRIRVDEAHEEATGSAVFANALYADHEVIHLMAYSILMLNTDMYNNSVKMKMDLEGLKSNMRGINNDHDLPDNIVQGIYDRIRGGKIEMPFEHVIHSTCGRGNRWAPWTVRHGDKPTLIVRRHASMIAVLDEILRVFEHRFVPQVRAAMEIVFTARTPYNEQLLARCMSLVGDCAQVGVTHAFASSESFMRILFDGCKRLMSLKEKKDEASGTRTTATLFETIRGWVVDDGKALPPERVRVLFRDMLDGVANEPLVTMSAKHVVRVLIEGARLSPVGGWTDLLALVLRCAFTSSIGGKWLMVPWYSACPSRSIFSRYMLVADEECSNVDIGGVAHGTILKIQNPINMKSVPSKDEKTKGDDDGESLVAAAGGWVSWLVGVGSGGAAAGDGETTEALLNPDHVAWLTELVRDLETIPDTVVGWGVADVRYFLSVCMDFVVPCFRFLVDEGPSLWGPKAGKTGGSEVLMHRGTGLDVLGTAAIVVFDAGVRVALMLDSPKHVFSVYTRSLQAIVELTGKYSGIGHGDGVFEVMLSIVERAITGLFGFLEACLGDESMSMSERCATVASISCLLNLQESFACGVADVVVGGLEHAARRCDVVFLAENVMSSFLVLMRFAAGEASSPDRIIKIMVHILESAYRVPRGAPGETAKPNAIPAQPGVDDTHVNHQGSPTSHRHVSDAVSPMCADVTRVAAVWKTPASFDRVLSIVFDLMTVCSKRGMLGAPQAMEALSCVVGVFSHLCCADSETSPGVRDVDRKRFDRMVEFVGDLSLFRIRPSWRRRCGAWNVSTWTSLNHALLCSRMRRTSRNGV